MRKIFLILLMAFIGSLLFADGVQPNGTGTESDPYQIATLDNLLWLSTTESLWANGSYYQQTADINASDTQNWNDGQGFSPIGNDVIEFTGFYNGQNHTITDLYINRPDNDFIALFGKMYYGAIHNLGLVNVSVSGHNNCAGLIGSDDYIDISDCYVIGYVEGSVYVGLLLGYAGNTTVENCFVNGSVEGSTFIGGMIGLTNGFPTASQCYFRNCYAIGSVFGIVGVGGFVGTDMSFVYDRCYSAVVVDAESQVGGFAGSVSYSPGFIDCFWDVEVSNQIVGAGPSSLPRTDELYGCTTLEMQTDTTYVNLGWDFDNTWSINPDLNGGYPYLRSMELPVSNEEEVMPPMIDVSYLNSAYPNPFNPETTIEFNVKKNEKGFLTIFNIKGQVVKEYREFDSGKHSVVWNGADKHGKEAASGVYFYRLKTQSCDTVKKMIMMK
ncbi:MAG: T9SS type A sorting domain-containing protein [Candidatus Cloacimonetes bacterium]|nr:T9SS type A sorting domain-containing protein [Candidatus Cloacimonadota bacterium]